MKAILFLRPAKVAVILMIFATLALAACGGETNEDLSAPALTMNALGPSTFTSERTLSGEVEVGAEVEVVVGSKAQVAEIDVADGSWSCTVSGLVVGANLVTVTASDEHGNTSSLQFILVRDLLRLDQLETVTSQPSSAVYGRLAPAANLTAVTLDGVETALPAPGEEFVLEFDALVAGSHTVRISAENPATGETQSVSQTIAVDPQAVALSIVRPRTPTQETSLVLAGSVEAGGTVTVSVEPEATTGAVTYVGTDWSVPIEGLQVRDHVITVTASLEGRPSASLWTRVTVEPAP